MSAVVSEGEAVHPEDTGERRQWFSFGDVAPRTSALAPGDEPHRRTVELLVVGARPELRLGLQFLQILSRTVELRVRGGAWHPWERVEVDGVVHEGWQEAEPRQVELTVRLLRDEREAHATLTLPGRIAAEALGEPAPGTEARAVRSFAPLEVSLRTECHALGAELWRVQATIENQSSRIPGAATLSALLRSTLASTHLVAWAKNGRLVSQQDDDTDEALSE